MVWVRAIPWGRRAHVRDEGTSPVQPELKNFTALEPTPERNERERHSSGDPVLQRALWWPDMP